MCSHSEIVSSIIVMVSDSCAWFLNMNYCLCTLSWLKWMIKISTMSNSQNAFAAPSLRSNVRNRWERVLKICDRSFFPGNNESLNAIPNSWGHSKTTPKNSMEAELQLPAPSDLSSAAFSKTLFIESTFAGNCLAMEGNHEKSPFSMVKESQPKHKIYDPSSKKFMFPSLSLFL